MNVSRLRMRGGLFIHAGSFQEKKFRLQTKMEQLKDRSKRVIENVEEKRNDIIRKWEEKSRDFIEAFLLLFGRDGRLVNT